MRRFHDRAGTKYNYQMNNNRNQAELAAIATITTTPSAARAAATTTTTIEPSGSGQESPAIGSLSALNRGKFIKSKSSPSSLTTHKFGLRPTPSPPRLIIDHQTGDIVERYPENPVYLRTFQPIEDDDFTVDDENQGHDDDDDDDTTQNQIDDSFATISSQHQHQQQSQHPLNHQIMSDQPSHQQLQNRPNPHRAHQQHGPVIPPPHTGKVYFAPPATNNNLFDPHLMQHNQASAPSGPSLRSVAQAALAANAHPAPSASFRRALNNLSDAERTDIAIVTEPEDYDTESAARPGASAGGGQLRITATSASKANALLAKQQPKYVVSTSANKLYGQPASSVSPSIGGVGCSGANSGAGDSHSAKWRALTQQQQQQQHQQQQQMLMMKRQKQIADADAKAQAPPLDDLNLYNFCYNFRILLVLLISASIVYLLVLPLNLDCTKYRPTYTYISIITASVNLIFVTIFTLFWYCNSVSRTLYQNLSSSAFIVTIYSILVCINLTIGIVFFFINTCHFQKMLVTHSVLAEVARYNSGGPNLAGASGLLLAVDSDKYNYNSNSDNYGRSYVDENEIGANSMKLETLSGPARYDKLDKEHLAAVEIVETIERQLMAETERLRNRQHQDRTDSDTVTLDNGLHSTDIDRDGTSLVRSRRQLKRRQMNTATPDSADGPTVIDDQLPYLQQQQQQQQQPQPGAGSGQPTIQPQSRGPTTSSSGFTFISDFFNQEHASGYEQVPEVSPIEAAWEYIKEQARQFRRLFYKFLVHYDLRFIGALHALCAACFQYLAIKVAVVRSYYCTPGGAFV